MDFDFLQQFYFIFYFDDAALSSEHRSDWSRKQWVDLKQGGVLYRERYSGGTHADVPLGLKHEAQLGLHRSAGGRAAAPGTMDLVLTRATQTGRSSALKCGELATECFHAAAGVRGGCWDGV